MEPPFYRVARVPFAELAPGDDLFGRVLRGDPNGVIVEGFLPPERAAAIVAKLEAGASISPRRRFAREFEAYSIGPCLDQAEGGLGEYLDAAPGFARAADELFEEDIHARFEAVLRALAGGRDVVLPRGPDGRPYGRFTLRCLPPGGRIPPHCENEQIRRPPYEHLRGLIDDRALISFYLTLAPAELGGELSIHALGAHELDRIATRARHSEPGGALEGRASTAVRPLAGDLIVFDGGRFFHQVLPVRGSANRWTMGGFSALSPDGRAVLAWA